MKSLKRAACLLLALVMVLAMSGTAFAADEIMQGGASTECSITVSSAADDETYKLYQILWLDVDDNIYKVNSYWKGFVEQSGIEGEYLNVDDKTGAVTWAKQYPINFNDTQKFAQLARDYAAKNSVSPVYNQTAKSDTIKFSNLKYGYYLLDTTLGTLCSLTMASPDATIQEKNTVPTNKKDVWEDSSKQWKSENDDDIGKKIDFRSTIEVKRGIENLTFHDTMSTGLTFKPETVVVQYSVLSAENRSDLVAETDYKLIQDPKKDDGDPEGCTFHIEFRDPFYKKINDDDERVNYQVFITYSAVLNEEATIGVDGNTNTSKISYGENNKFSVDSTTTTKTWKIPVFKFKEGDVGLANAKFTLSVEKTGDPIKLIETKAGGSTEAAIYRVATPEEAAKTDGSVTIITEITTKDSGKFEIQGLDSGTYFLTETHAPNGYNKLANPVPVTINPDGTIQRNLTKVEEIAIKNQTGSELPSTGGIGTTIFYTVGGAMVLAAVVLLVTKKRMSE